ncbi:hypothetical protein EGW08_017652, partial [Elysia chlorotica]
MALCVQSDYFGLCVSSLKPLYRRSSALSNVQINIEFQFCLHCDYPGAAWLTDTKAMAMHQYFLLSKKIQSQVLSTFCKHSLHELFSNNFSKGLGKRALNKLTIPTAPTESDSPKWSTSARKDKEDISYISEFGDHHTDSKAQTEKLEQQRLASETVEHNTWSKVKSSSAARKYFKKTFLDRFPSIVQETGGNKTADADVFGTLSNNTEFNNDYQRGSNFRDERNPNERVTEAFPEDVDEIRDRRQNIPLTREGRIGKNAYYYTRKMSILGRQGKIKEAISIFDDWMMLRDRVMPNKRTFNVLIGIIGRVGYTDKAFELYMKMRSLGLDPEGEVYTGLFNACANSPWPKKSLKQAENLISSLQSKGIQLNLITVKAAAKAMAFCGNFPKAFVLLDEASAYTGLDVECFDHLLMACAADKSRGFHRAVQVWQKMQELNIQPQTSSFNLLIRTARDCGINEPDEFAKDNNVASETFCSHSRKDNISGIDHKQQYFSVAKSSQSSRDLMRVNRETLCVKDVTTPALRLELLGGARKLILHMAQCGANPDVRTFSQLVPCLPDTKEADNELLQLMEEMGVTPDVDLFNDIMSKRNFRHDSQSAKVKLMNFFNQHL